MTAAVAAVVPIVSAIRLKRILYATDFSDGSRTALGVVSTIARRYQSEVFVAHICPLRPYILVTPEAVSTMEKRREHEARVKLADLQRVTSALRVSTKPIVKIGDPVEELRRIARDKNIELVILSTHGRVGLKHVMMGSVAEALLRKLPCPVLTVGPHLAHRFLGMSAIGHILFPTDLSEESRAVFPLLASLADEYSARITVLHVLPPETAQNPDAKALAEPLRREMIRVFAPEISPRCEVEFLIESGDTAERILACARDRKADLIGLGIRKAGELATHFQNTVTYRVLLNARCPVLTNRFHPQW